MSRGNVNTFVLIMHFLNNEGEPYPITIEFFEITNTFESAMAFTSEHYKTLKFNVCVLAYVKDERNNLFTMTFSLTFISFKIP
jgi:hypothetical protein